MGNTGLVCCDGACLDSYGRHKGSRAPRMDRNASTLSSIGSEGGDLESVKHRKASRAEIQELVELLTCEKAVDEQIVPHTRFAWISTPKCISALAALKIACLFHDSMNKTTRGKLRQKLVTAGALPLLVKMLFSEIQRDKMQCGLCALVELSKDSDGQVSADLYRFKVMDYCVRNMIDSRRVHHIELRLACADLCASIYGEVPDLRTEFATNGGFEALRAILDSQISHVSSSSRLTDILRVLKQIKTLVESADRPGRANPATAVLAIASDVCPSLESVVNHDYVDCIVGLESLASGSNVSLESSPADPGLGEDRMSVFREALGSSGRPLRSSEKSAAASSTTATNSVGSRVSVVSWNQVTAEAKSCLALIRPFVSSTVRAQDDMHAYYKANS